ncbi:MAG: PAS domain S-box protein [Steroidobacterales bacterium]
MSAVPTPQAMPGESEVSGADASIGLAQHAVRDLAAVAALICEAPFASISLPGADITWSSPEKCADHAPLPDHHRFDPFALSAAGLFEVPDAAADPRFAPVPGFYAGVPLVDAGGKVYGTLAVVDAVARRLTAPQRAALLALASNVSAQIALCEELTVVRAVTESAAVAIYHTDANGNMNYVNPAYRKIFGLAPEQSFEDWPIAVHPEDRAQLQADWADFCRQPRPIGLQYRTEPAGGELRHFSEFVVAVEGAPGFVGTITDVTKLAAARNDLRRSETLFQNTCEQAPIGIAYTDRAGRFLRCNQAFGELLGFGADELERWSVADLTHGEDRAHVAGELERLWRGDVRFVDLEKRYRRKDGTVLWVRTTTALVREGDAAPECSVEFVRDITVRKAMADALLQNQTLLEAVIANLPVALLACDAAGKITRYNRAAEALFSIPVARALHGASGRYPLAAEVYLSDGLTPVPPAERPLARALRGEIISDLELVVVPSGSAPRATVTNARRLVDPQGQTLGAVSIIQDITERKIAEIELERVHKQLISASREAGMAEIATNVLHNVGNVLNSVNISASVLADRIKQSKPAGLRRVAALLQDRSADLAEFISTDERGRQLPTYLAQLAEQLQADQRIALEEITSLRGNIEHIKDTVTMQQSYAKRCGVAESVAASAIVEDCLRINAGSLARHGITVVRQFDDVPPITIDRHKVLQILVNLVHNATHACDESGRPDKTVTISIAGGEEQVRICVIDNGVGIPAENMTRLFTHGFTTRKAGHGFGLHSAALTARDLGGSLGARSDGHGCGASFALDLPLKAPRA